MDVEVANFWAMDREVTPFNIAKEDWKEFLIYTAK